MDFPPRAASVVFFRALTLASALFLAAHSQAADPILKVPVTTDRTPEGVRFGWLGKRPAHPSPTVFFFGGGVEDSFDYPDAIHAFGQDVLCVALDLPGHGQEVRPNEPKSMRAWRYRLEHGE